jgi:hypothetical protein
MAPNFFCLKVLQKQLTSTYNLEEILRERLNFFIKNNLSKDFWIINPKEAHFSNKLYIISHNKEFILSLALRFKLHSQIFITNSRKQLNFRNQTIILESSIIILRILAILKILNSHENFH